ncbi:hypothetical protein BJ508DRAFT_313962 [Ascobolus immersus RN42]|uniref:Uncharacterized protein n=1 Tax=Ascobolus immersus RN42 TaxID=1160509 RepID=A0A3N4HIW2_ASCIM|nr:hypothetical protein BJ508DRAFT_313962 [Ascobolus immersus RN42]
MPATVGFESTLKKEIKRHVLNRLDIAIDRRSYSIRPSPLQTFHWVQQGTYRLPSSPDGVLKELRSYSAVEAESFINALNDGRLFVRSGAFPVEPCLYTGNKTVFERNVLRDIVSFGPNGYAGDAGRWKALAESLQGQLNGRQIAAIANHLEARNDGNNLHPLCGIGAYLNCVIGVIDEYQNKEHMLQLYKPLGMDIISMHDLLFSHDPKVRVAGYLITRGFDGDPLYYPLLLNQDSDYFYQQLSFASRAGDGWCQVIRVICHLHPSALDEIATRVSISSCLITENWWFVIFHKVFLKLLPGRGFVRMLRTTRMKSDVAHTLFRV